MKIQLKTVLDDSKTSSWEIHKTMLRPSYEFCEELGFEYSPEGTGIQGGIILVELSPGIDSLDVTYYYTDILVITALYLQIVNKSPKIQKKTLCSFRQKIASGTSHDKIAVPRSFFVKAKTPEHLLGLMGLHSRKSRFEWFHLIAIAEDHFLRPVNDPDIPIPFLRRFIAEQLISLTDDLS